MDAPLAPIVASTAGTMAILAALAWYARGLRKAPFRSRGVPRAVSNAVVDSLGGIWTELNWFVSEDPRMDDALTDLGRVVALVSERESGTLSAAWAEAMARADAPSALDAEDVDAILDQVRGTTAWRVGVQSPDSNADPLKTYLLSLSEPRAPLEALVPPR